MATVMTSRQRRHAGGPVLHAVRDAPPANIDLSIVVPVRDEADSIDSLLAEIEAATKTCGTVEIIYVDDGSKDGTSARLAACQALHPALRVVRHADSLGQSAALRSGVLAARGPLIVTLDGDGQNDPQDIPRLLAAYQEAPPGSVPGLIAGQRVRRHDSVLRRWASGIANGVRRAVLKDSTRDTGCGLKLMRRDAFLALPFFDHVHRFLPALMRSAGYEVLFLSVNHRPRLAGTSKYGILDRLWVGIVDLAGVYWLQRRYRYFPGCGVETVRSPEQ